MKYYSKIVFTYLILLISSLLILNFLELHKIILMPFYSYCLYGFGLLALVIYTVPLVLRKHKIYLTDIIIYLLVLIGILSTIYAYDIQKALWGHNGWHEGLFSLCSYYFIFLISRYLNKEYIKKIIYIFLCTGFFHLIYTTFQILDFDFVYKPIMYASGIFYNVNYFSGYCVLGLGLSIGLFCYEKRKINFIFVILFIYLLFLANSTSGLLAMAVMFVIVLFHKKVMKAVYLYLISLGIFLFCGLFIELGLFEEINKIFSETNMVVNDVSNITEVGTNRGYIYVETIPFIKEHLLNGIGIDNFMYINNGYPIVNMDEGIHFSKIHSDLYQILITQGIFALLLYVILYIVVLFKYFKYKKNILTTSLFICIVGYIVQVQFNISIIQVAPMFFMFLGLFEGMKLNDIV